MSNARNSTGILLKRGNGASPQVYTSLAEITSLTPPGFSRNEIEVSNHNEGTEAKILGILRHGQVSGTCNWLPDNATQNSSPAGMMADIVGNTEASWQIAFPPSGLPTFTFNARVQNFSPTEQPVDGALQMNFALTLSSTVTVAYS